MISIAPNVCVASADAFLGQQILSYLASTAGSAKIASLGCLYDAKHPECFNAYFDSAAPWSGNPASKLGISAMCVDYTNAAVVAQCLMGFDCVVVCPPEEADPEMVKSWCEWIVAGCKTAGVCQVVCMSTIGCEASSCQQDASCDWETREEMWAGVNAEVLGCRFACERICRAAYPDCPILRCSFLQEYFAAWLETCVKQENCFKACWGRRGVGDMAPVSIKDVAKCCATMLGCGGLATAANGSKKWNVSAPHAGAVFSLTGPKCYNANEIADCLKMAAGSRADAFGGYRECSVAEQRACLGKATAWGPMRAEMCCALVRLAGADECGWTTRDCAELGGGECVSLEAWCAEHC